MLYTTYTLTKYFFLNKICKKLFLILKIFFSFQAFGVGAFEEEDADIYSREDMSQYDFSMSDEVETKKKKKENNSNKMVIYYFCYLKMFLMTNWFFILFKYQINASINTFQ